MQLCVSKKSRHHQGFTKNEYKNMLSGNFYTIQSILQEEGSVNATLELNSQHPIFAGHFPNQPVVPGACLLQIVKEIIQTVTKIDLQLLNASQIKFLSIIDPTKNSIVQIVIKYTINENTNIAVSATFSYDTTTCCKFNGVFKRTL
jgi:3-hydroxyacyl-[acyl-carrier-protein] dehydratase